MKTISMKDLSEVPDNFTGIIEWDGGAVEYFLNGKCHRLDGPAYSVTDYEEYIINGKFICDTINYKDYEQYFYNSKEYKIAKKQHDLLNNLKLVKNIT